MRSLHLRSLTPEKQGEKPAFCQAKMQRSPRTANFPGKSVNLHVPCSQHRTQQNGWPTQQSTHARKHLALMKWSDQIIIGSSIETADAVFHAAPEAGDEDRHGAMLGPQGAHGVQAIPAAQFARHDQQVVSRAPRLVYKLYERGNGVHPVASVSQRRAQQRWLARIFSNKYPHAPDRNQAKHAHCRTLHRPQRRPPSALQMMPARCQLAALPRCCRWPAFASLTVAGSGRPPPSPPPPPTPSPPHYLGPPIALCR